MKEPILKIPQRIYGKDSKVITMRIGKEMLQALDAAAKQSNRSRNEILSMALEFSLEHMVLADQTPDAPAADALIITEKGNK